MEVEYALSVSKVSLLKIMVLPVTSRDRDAENAVSSEKKAIVSYSKLYESCMKLHAYNYMT